MTTAGLKAASPTPETMGADVPEPARTALEANEAFEPAGEGYAVSTARFESLVTAEMAEDRSLRFTVTVLMPMLSSAVAGDVGPTVEAGWFETLERRLADATLSTRADVELDAFGLETTDGDAVATFAFTVESADLGASVAQTIVEYAEGTYVEGIVPGYEYREPVAGLIDRARQGDEGASGPMPL